MTDTTPTIAVFRPDDERLTSAIEYLQTLGAEPLADPMLAVERTDECPREDAAYTILTSKTGGDILADTDWHPGGRLCAIGETSADALRDAGYDVDIVPETYSSTGLVDRLADEIDGERVEVARSNHGSAVLLDGLEDAGAYVHETVLYRLVRPEGAGESAERAADGALDGVLFTSSLTVEHFLAAASERGVDDVVLSELEEAVVGAIGDPTRETAEEHGISVDVVPGDADFEALADAVLDQASDED